MEINDLESKKIEKINETELVRLKDKQEKVAKIKSNGSGDITNDTTDINTHTDMKCKSDTTMASIF